MFDIRALAPSSISKFLLTVLFVFISSQASAQVFDQCQVSSSAWDSKNTEKKRDVAKKREELRCAAENAALSEWSAKLKKLNDALRTMRSGHVWTLG
jgi:hypothetical protein